MTGLCCREMEAGLFEIMVGRAKKCLWGIWLCSGLALCVWNAESAGGGLVWRHRKMPALSRLSAPRLSGEAAFLCHAGGWNCQQLDSRGRRVQKDTIIATVNEDEIELERKELEVKF